MKNENKFWGGVTKSPYQTPETETINVSMEVNIMSNKNGSIPGLEDSGIDIGY